MREDLQKLRRQLAHAKPWAKGGRVAVRTAILEALLDLVEAGDKATAFGQGTGYYRARAELAEAMQDAGDFDRAVAEALGSEPIEISGSVEP